MSGVEIHQTSESSAEVLPAKGRGVAEVARAVLAVGREEDAAVDTVTSRGRVAFRVRKDPVDGTIDRLEERLLTGAVEPSGDESGGNTHPDGPEANGDGEDAPEGPSVDPEPEEGTEDADDGEDTPSLEEILASEDEPVTAPARSASKVTWQDFLTDQNVQWSNEDSRDDLISRWEEAAGTVSN